MLSRFHLIPEHNGRTDGRTDRFAISISRVSMLTRELTRDQNRNHYNLKGAAIVLQRYGVTDAGR